MIVKVVFSVILFSLLSLFPSVSAREDQNRMQAQLRPSRDLGNICERMDQRIEAKIAAFGENRDAHVNKYLRVKERLTTISEEMAALGLDVSKLNEDLEIFSGMIDEYIAEYKEFIDLLRVAAGIDCVNAQSEFKEALQQARVQMMAVQDKRRELLEFYREVLREDIKELREQASEL